MDVVKAQPEPQGAVIAHTDTDDGVGFLKRALRQNMRQYGMLTALAFIVILFEYLTNGVLLKPLNVTNLIAQNSYILILAIGMVMVIINGHIDLSVGSLAAFVGAAGAVLMINDHVPWPVAVVICLGIGALAGAWQGFWIAYIGVPSFIVTLGGMLVFRGGTSVLLGSSSLAPFPTGFGKIATGFVPDIGTHSVNLICVLAGVVLSALIVARDIRARQAQVRYSFDVSPLPWFLAKLIGSIAVVNAFTVVLANYQGIPVILVILLGLLGFYSFVMSTSVFGRHIYAVGGNRAAAALSGVRAKRNSFLVFVNMGVLSALSGLVFAARLNSGTPEAGVNFELEAIAAAFIGGASASGGVGTVFGALIGGLVLGVLNNGMSIEGIDSSYQQVIKGLVLLAAVGFDIFNKRKAGS